MARALGDPRDCIHMVASLSSFVCVCCSNIIGVTGVTRASVVHPRPSIMCGTRSDSWTSPYTIDPEHRAQPYITGGSSHHLAMLPSTVQQRPPGSGGCRSPLLPARRVGQAHKLATGVSRRVGGLAQVRRGGKGAGAHKVAEKERSEGRRGHNCFAPLVGSRQSAPASSTPDR